MKILPLLLLGGGAYFLTKKKVPTTSSGKSTSKNYENTEIIPDTVDKKVNDAHISQYYQVLPYYLDNVPAIYSDLNDELQFVYRQSYHHNNEKVNDPKFNKSYIYINQKFATEVWDLANFIVDRDFKNGKISKDVIDYNNIANTITFEILNTLSPDVWWKNGLEPYTLNSPFNYVWKSTNFVVKIAFVNYMLKTIGNNQYTDKWALPLSIEG